MNQRRQPNCGERMTSFASMLPATALDLMPDHGIDACAIIEDERLISAQFASWELLQPDW